MNNVEQINRKFNQYVEPIAKPTTLLEIIMAMKQRTRITINNHCGKSISGIVNGIQVEDGSGKSWNVLVNSGLFQNTIHIRE